MGEALIAGPASAERVLGQLDPGSTVTPQLSFLPREKPV